MPHDRQPQFWNPSLQPQAVMLSPVDHKDDDTEPILTLAHLDGLDLRRAADGWHGIWQVDGVAHQFWLPEVVPDAAAFYAVTLPMDSFLELRAHAARRFWRSLNGRAPGPDFRAVPDATRSRDVIDRRQERTERRREHLAELNRRITDADQRLGRLFDAIEAGMVDKDDAMAKERMTSLKALRDQAAADAERTQLSLDSSGNQGVTPDMLKGFARKARERIQLDDGGYRRDHLRAFAQRVEVADDEVRIMGSKSELLRTLVAASSVETAAFGVHSSVLKWRTRQDSLRAQNIVLPAFSRHWPSDGSAHSVAVFVPRLSQDKHLFRISMLLKKSHEEGINNGGDVYAIASNGDVGPTHSACSAAARRALAEI